MSPKSTTFSTRVSQETLSRWKAATGNFNQWVVAALEAQYELDQAETRDRDHAKQERLAMVQSLTPMVEPASSLKRRSREMCVHRRRGDEFCPRCAG